MPGQAHDRANGQKNGRHAAQAINYAAGIWHANCWHLRVMQADLHTDKTRLLHTPRQRFAFAATN
jgi:ureidoglycolate hydrolase